MYINNMDRGCDFVYQDERADTAKLLLQLGVKNDQIVFADGRKLENVGVLVLRIAALLVM